MTPCSRTIAPSHRLPPLASVCIWELSKSGPSAIKTQNPPLLVSIWPLTLALVSSTSWTVCSSEGPEKHHGMDWESILNFTTPPPLVWSAPIQVNVICVVKWKTSFCLVGHFRLIVCTMYLPKRVTKRSDWPLADLIFKISMPTVLYCFGSSSLHISQDIRGNWKALH